MRSRRPYVRLTEDLVVALDLLAADRGVSRSQLITKAIERYLADSINPAIDQEIVDAYTRQPEIDEPSWEAALRASIDAEPW